MVTISVGFVLLIFLGGTVSTTLSKEQTGVRKAVVLSIAFWAVIALILQLPVFSIHGNDFSLLLKNWQLPFASMSAGVDPLTTLFLIPLLILTAVCTLYGSRYFDKHYEGRFHWFFFSMLAGGMVMVLLARNAIFFLLAWEIMSLASFFLVINNTRDKESLNAGWLYFVTAHVGTAFLLALFLLLSVKSGSFEFADWKLAQFSPSVSNAIFILSLIAFGMKAGFIPFHVWLPHAHPAAPSHVSALMSGIMIKMGIYGIVRILTFITPFQAWWGILLLIIGAISGILGILFAIGQHDIKRLLAWSSVENIGIILLGLGTGILGSASGSNTVALLGFTGALLHVLNHAFFKSLLFLGAGALIRQTGTGEIDRLGGIMKSMPFTGVLFLTGATAICGLPVF